MQASRSEAQEGPCHPLDAHTYTGTETLLHNLPYILMIVLIPVIVPLWFLPLLAAVPALLRDFTWGLVGLAVAFALDAFIILPRFSTQHGCRECPQREGCPWMGSPR